ncbi:c-type cytochrome [Azospirillum sp. A39]|uniref:c-type cytochrome n=1 Tax=Azospirillum sp. A39 TaxID=3462279 RepID=UPI004045A862
MRGRSVAGGILWACAVLVPAAAPAGPAGDAERGRAVVVGAGPGGRATACLGCHGLDGAGDAQAGFPRLDTLSPFYLYKQLKDYAGGQRSSRAMEPIARGLDDRAMRDVAAYYAGRAAVADPPPAAPAVLELGRAVAERGVPERDVQPCDACHGPGGRGIPPAIPGLAGQHAGYLHEQLVQWRHGLRTSDPLGAMAWVAARLTVEEMRAVAAWYAAQPGGAARVSAVPSP